MDVVVSPDGKVSCAGQLLGQLDGLLLVQTKTDGELAAKAEKPAAQRQASDLEKALVPEIDRRLTEIAGSGQGAISLSDHGEILWAGKPVGKLKVGDAILKPSAELIGGEHGNGVLRSAALGRLIDFLRLEIDQKLACLFALRDFAQSPTSFKDARVLARMLFENHGHLDQRKHHKLIKETSSQARGYIRNLGGIVGFNYVYMQDLMKPAAARLLSILFAFAWDKDGGGKGNPFFPANGMTSLPAVPNYSEPVLNMAGYTRRGARFIRFDILNRLTDIIFQAIKDRNDDGRFVLKKQMMALLGCSVEDLEELLRKLGYTKITQKFTKKEAEAHQTYVKAYFERQALVRAAQEKGEDITATLPPLIEKPAGPVTDKNHPDYVPKRQRKEPLEDHIAVPQKDEDGQPIFETHLSLWKKSRRKARKPSRYKPSRRADDESASQAENAPDMNTDTVKPASRKPLNMADYADFTAAKNPARQMTNKRAKPGASSIRPKPVQPSQASWTPPKKNDGASGMATSPFAALADLQFSDTEKPDPKNKDKKADKP